MHKDTGCNGDTSAKDSFAADDEEDDDVDVGVDDDVDVDVDDDVGDDDEEDDDVGVDVGVAQVGVGSAVVADVCEHENSFTGGG